MEIGILGFIHSNGMLGQGVRLYRPTGSNPDRVVRKGVAEGLGLGAFRSKHLPKKCNKTWENQGESDGKSGENGDL